jgi:DNA invertase Pin-like site-specific DNA recombinase
MSEITYRAIDYLRISHSDTPRGKDERENESDSIGNQRKMIADFLKNHPEIEVVDEKVDDGFSGILFDRPAFKEMMTAIEAGDINCVIVKDLSRLGREYIETGRYLRRIFPAYGVRFIAINDNIDTLKDSGDDLVVSVKSIINDAYCRDISVKTRSALNIKRENGDYVGGCPVYGYAKTKADKNQLVVDDYPASIVREIFRMKIDGFSALRIANTLNSNGVLSPIQYKKDRGLPHPKKGYADKADAKWSATTIIRILNDETYTGTLVQCRQSTLNYKIKDIIEKPKSEWKRTENAHEAIVGKQDFDLVQKIMRLDTRTAPGGNQVYIFSGILICGCCGARMTRKSVPKKDGGKYNYYCCPTTKKHGCTDSPSLKESDLSDCILESVKARVANVTSLESILTGTDGQKAAAALARSFEEQISDNESQLSDIGGYKSALYESMINGLLSKDDYKTLKAKYVSDETRLRDAIVKQRQELDDILSGKNERLKWTEHFKRFENLTALDRRTVINLIASIRVVSKTELVVTYNFQSEYDSAAALLKKAVA